MTFAIVVAYLAGAMCIFEAAHYARAEREFEYRADHILPLARLTAWVFLLGYAVQTLGAK